MELDLICHQMMEIPKNCIPVEKEVAALLFRPHCFKCFSFEASGILPFLLRNDSLCL